MKYSLANLESDTIQYIRTQYPALFFILRVKEQAKIGIPTIIIFRKTSKALGLCIELKSPDRTQSGPQQEFQRRVQAEGWAYYVCHSFDEARIRIDAYLRESYVVNKS